MVFKYNFTYLKTIDNPFVGIIAELSHATAGVWGYTVLGVIYIVASYVFLRRTNDIGKSLISALHIITILSFLLFYMGREINVMIISDVFMLGVAVIESIAIAGIYFAKSKNN